MFRNSGGRGIFCLEVQAVGGGGAFSASGNPGGKGVRKHAHSTEVYGFLLD